MGLPTNIGAAKVYAGVAMKEMTLGDLHLASTGQTVPVTGQSAAKTDDLQGREKPYRCDQHKRTDFGFTLVITPTCTKDRESLHVTASCEACCGMEETNRPQERG